MLPKYPPTGAGRVLPSSLCVLLDVIPSSYEEIYLELFLDLFSAITFFRYLIWSNKI